MSTPGPLPTTLLPAFDAAQRQTIALTRAVVARLEAGMSPPDIARLAEALAPEHGFTGWFHPPEVDLDPRPPPARGLLRRGDAGPAVLRPGVLVQLDLGPSTADAFGDFGTAFVFGGGGGSEPRVVAEARDICRATCGFAGHQKCVGELFVFAQSWANNRRLQLGASRAIGHACLPPEGLAALAWPRGARAATWLRRNQIQWFNPRYMAGVYAVRPPVVCDGYLLAFEEMIYVDGMEKRALGRDRYDEIGTL